MFTISAGKAFPEFASALKKKQIIISSESDYLRKRNLLQIAFFGYYREHDLEKLLVAIREIAGVVE